MASHENFELEDPVSARQARDLPVFPFVYSAEDLRAYWSTVNVAVGLLLATAGTFLAVLITATDPQTRSGRHYVAWSLLCFITTLLINLSQQISFATASSGLDRSRERTDEDTELAKCYLQDNLHRWFTRLYFPGVHAKHLTFIEERDRAVKGREKAGQEREKAGEEREKVIRERRLVEQGRVQARSRLQQQQDAAQDEETLATLADMRLHVEQEIEVQRKEAVMQEEEKKLQSEEMMVQNGATLLQDTVSNSRIQEVGRQLEDQSRKLEAASRSREKASMERERKSVQREKAIGDGEQPCFLYEAAQVAHEEALQKCNEAYLQRVETRTLRNRFQTEHWFLREFRMLEPSAIDVQLAPIAALPWFAVPLSDFLASPFGLFLRFLHYQNLACIQTFAFLALIAGLALLGATLIKIGLIVEGSLIIVITCGGPLLGLGPPTFLHFIRVPPEYYPLS